jgi:hypothetical protein
MKIRYSSSRGQAGITDLFVAIAIFIVLVTITTLTWDLYNARLESSIDYDTMVIKAYYIADTFVKSPGYPVNWESYSNPELTTSTIGLASSDRVLADAKVGTFASLSTTQYDAVRTVLRLSLYDYYFVLRDTNNTVIYSAGKIPQGKFAVNLARLAVYQNKPVIMEFAVWKP